MKKIIVIGSPGAGKSTFSRKLCKVCDIPIFYLDMIWHKPDKTTVSREEFDGRLSEILKRDNWIIDGNYSRTLETRLKECDTVFLFDIPLSECLSGVESRIGKSRPDMPWIEEEFDVQFRQYICDFPQSTLPKIYELLKNHANNKSITVFRTRSDADNFVKELEKAYNSDNSAKK
jgi:adenylate kinase family enzyme